MLTFKKDKKSILKVLRDLVDEIIDNSDVTSWEQDSLEFLTDLMNKRKIRQLKKLRRELDKWIKDGVNESPIIEGSSLTGPTPNEYGKILHEQFNSP